MLGASCDTVQNVLIQTTSMHILALSIVDVDDKRSLDEGLSVCVFVWIIRVSVFSVHVAFVFGFHLVYRNESLQCTKCKCFCILVLLDIHFLQVFQIVLFHK